MGRLPDGADCWRFFTIATPEVSNGIPHDYESDGDVDLDDYAEFIACITGPGGTAAREIMDSETIIAVARNAPESDICGSVIDLDRCLFLQENGYDVMYREEIFFAHKRCKTPG
ncbi:MAG: hypothetical protein WBE26_13485 [Phycisphaerae bacterium]